MAGLNSINMAATDPSLLQTRSAEARLKSAAGRIRPGTDDETLRRTVGEFVGGVFYGTILRQMQSSKLKGEYMHGGRGEEVFQGQLGIELAKRMGGSLGDPVSNRMYESFKRHLTKVGESQYRQSVSESGPESKSEPEGEGR